MEKRSFELSVWEDYLDSGGKFKEKKISVIGTSNGDSPILAYSIVLKENINGERTLNFKMPKKFVDSNGETKDNPLINYLGNERKIKLRNGEPYPISEGDQEDEDRRWIDFVIKQVEEDPYNHFYSYTAKEVYVNELGKNGWSTTLDLELGNNFGTLRELGERVLQNSDWRIGQVARPIDKIEEILFVGRLSSSINATQMIYGTPTIVPSGSYVYFFYTSVRNEDGNWVLVDGEKQFLYLGKALTLSDADDSRVVLDPYSNYNLTYTGNIGLVSGSLRPTGLQDGASQIALKGNKIDKKQIMMFEPILQNYAKKYSLKAPMTNNGVSLPAGTEVFGVEKVTYVTPYLVENILTNTSNFITGVSWTDANGENPLVKMVPKLDSSTLDGKSLDNWIEEEYAMNYLTLNLPLGKSATNKGPSNDRLSVTQDELYVVRMKARWILKDAINYDDTILTSDYPNLNVSLVKEDENETKVTNTNSIRPVSVSVSSDNSLKGYPLDSSIQDKTYRKTYAEIGNNSSIDEANHVYVILKANTTTKFPTDKLRLKIENSGGPAQNNYDLYIENIELFKYVEEYVYGINGEIINSYPIFPGDLPKSEPIVEKTFYYVPENAQTEEEILFLSQEENKYDPIFQLGYEKIRSISVKESNYFNILQTLAETFEVWVSFEVSHKKNGETLLENGYPVKKVNFSEHSPSLSSYNWAGFKYGINVKSIKRNLDSDTLATKVIVKDASQEHARDGLVSISRAVDNPSKEREIYDFSYYVNHGLISYDLLLKDMFGTSQGEEGYLWKLRRINERVQTIFEKVGELNTEVERLEKEFIIYDSAFEEAKIILEDYEKENIELAKDDPKREENLEEMARITRQKSNYEIIRNNIDEKIILYQEEIEEYIDEEKVLQQNRLTLKFDFYKKYSRFIQEGIWTDSSYISDDLYYLDAVKVASTSAFPKVTYTIDVIDLSAVEGLDPFHFKIGQETYIEDTEFFGYTYEELPTGDMLKTPFRQGIIITEKEVQLDDASKDRITVKTYKNQFEDLFRKINASSNQLKYEGNDYRRAAAAVLPTGEISFSALANSFANNSLILSSSTNQSVIWDTGTGIEVINNENTSERLRIVAGGLFVSQDGGRTWTAGITGAGINTNHLLAGKIDTAKINLWHENDVLFRWDRLGISAFKEAQDPTIEGVERYSVENYVRFNQYGLYGTENGVELDTKLKLLDSQMLPSDTKFEEKIQEIQDESIFSLTWRGLVLKSKDGSIYLSTEDRNIRIIDENNIVRVILGYTEFEEKDYWGLLIFNQEEENIFRQTEEGDLIIRGSLRYIQEKTTGELIHTEEDEYGRFKMQLTSTDEDPSPSKKDLDTNLFMERGEGTAKAELTIGTRDSLLVSPTFRAAEARHALQQGYYELAQYMLKASARLIRVTVEFNGLVETAEVEGDYGPVNDYYEANKEIVGNTGIRLSRQTGADGFNSVTVDGETVFLDAVDGYMSGKWHFNNQIVGGFNINPVAIGPDTKASAGSIAIGYGLANKTANESIWLGKTTSGLTWDIVSNNGGSINKCIFIGSHPGAFFPMDINNIINIGDGNRVGGTDVIVLGRELRTDPYYLAPGEYSFSPGGILIGAGSGLSNAPDSISIGNKHWVSSTEKSVVIGDFCSVQGGVSSIAIGYKNSSGGKVISIGSEIVSYPEVSSGDVYYKGVGTAISIGEDLYNESNEKLYCNHSSEINFAYGDSSTGYFFEAPWLSSYRLGDWREVTLVDVFFYDMNGEMQKASNIGFEYDSNKDYVFGPLVYIDRNTGLEVKPDRIKIERIVAIQPSFGLNKGLVIGTESSTVNGICLGTYSVAHAKTGDIDDDFFGSLEAITIGHHSQSYRSITIGSNSFSSGTPPNTVFDKEKVSIVIGSNSSAYSGAIALGCDSIGTANDSITIGNNCRSYGENAITIGAYSKGFLFDSIAIGAFSKSLGEHSVAIGAGSITNTIDTSVIQLGNNDILELRCAVSLSIPSDERDKTDIVNISSALDFINLIDAVQYVDNNRKKYLPSSPTTEEQELLDQYGLIDIYDEIDHAAGTLKDTRKKVGIKAQQVQEALLTIYEDSDYANIVNNNLRNVETIPEEVESQLTVNYSAFVPFLIAATQELSVNVEYLKTHSGVKDEDVVAFIDDEESLTRASLDTLYLTTDGDIYNFIYNTTSDTRILLDSLYLVEDEDIVALIQNPLSLTRSLLDSLYSGGGSSEQTVSSVEGQLIVAPVCKLKETREFDSGDEFTGYLFDLTEDLIPAAVWKVVDSVSLEIYIEDLEETIKINEVPLVYDDIEETFILGPVSYIDELENEVFIDELSIDTKISIEDESSNLVKIDTTHNEKGSYIKMIGTEVLPYGSNVSAVLGRLDTTNLPNTTFTSQFISEGDYGLYTNSVFLEDSLILPNSGLSNRDDKNYNSSSIRAWIGQSFSSRDTAPFIINENGDLKANNIEVIGDLVSSLLNIGNDGAILTGDWASNGTFSFSEASITSLTSTAAIVATLEVSTIEVSTLEITTSVASTSLNTDEEGGKLTGDWTLNGEPIGNNVKDIDIFSYIDDEESLTRTLLDELYASNTMSDGSIADIIEDEESLTRLALDNLYSGGGGGSSPIIAKDGGYILDLGSPAKGPIGTNAIDFSYSDEFQSLAFRNMLWSSIDSDFSLYVEDWLDSLRDEHLATGGGSLGDYSFSSGMANFALHGSATIGMACLANSNSVAMGTNNKSIGWSSFSSGVSNCSTGESSTTFGTGTLANNNSGLATGVLNKAFAQGSGNFINPPLTGDAFVIGNGGIYHDDVTEEEVIVRSNAFRVNFEGETFGLSAFNSSGADYAEYFEWEDGNLEEEDRVGYFVTLEGDKIRKANSTDTYLLGVISVNPSVVGDSHQDDWHGKYVRDEWGRLEHEQTKAISKFNLENESLDSPELRWAPKINPNWNKDKKYIPRKQRKEWAMVGMMGKLLVRDDGTCQPNSYCYPNDEGIATSSLQGFRVMKRVTKNIIQIVLK